MTQQDKSPAQALGEMAGQLVIWTLAFLIEGAIVHFLWNATLPRIFSTLPAIDFGGALGLVGLSSVLFRTKVELKNKAVQS